MVVADWRVENADQLPSMIHWLHNAAINGNADEYAAGHIAGFKIGEQDVLLCPELEGISMVYMCYRGKVVETYPPQKEVCDVPREL